MMYSLQMTFAIWSTWLSGIYVSEKLKEMCESGLTQGECSGKEEYPSSNLNVDIASIVVAIALKTTLSQVRDSGLLPSYGPEIKKH